MNKFDFFDSSKQATSSTIRDTGVGASVYPWQTLPIGKSFFVDTSEVPVKLQTMQSNCSRMGKKLGRRFRAIKHEKGIEVARLADPITDENVNQIAGDLKQKASDSVGIAEPETVKFPGKEIAANQEKAKFDFFGDKENKDVD